MRTTWLLAAVVAMAVVLTGCRGIGVGLRPPEFPAYASFEVWNRTLEPAFLVDADGTRLDVPACGHASVGRLRVNHVQVRTARGYVSGFGSPGAGPRQFMVLVAEPGESFPTDEPPSVLPPCSGLLDAQPGV